MEEALGDTANGSGRARSSGLILGLGNPGERYSDTRHNLGFRVLDLLVKKAGSGKRTLECNSLLAGCGGKDEGLRLAWPQTYMNRSGYAARCLCERLEVEAADLLVVYDEVALPVGRMRMRKKGGPGGHRGMESVIGNLRTEEIARLRLGVGPESSETSETSENTRTDEDLSDYVLSPFRADERETVDEMIERAAEACLAWWREGVEPAMNRFNAS